MNKIESLRRCVNASCMDSSMRDELMEFLDSMDWISVEDRLPEDRGSILIFTKHGGYTVYYYPGHRERFYTHWMPLPEPPKPKAPTFKDVFLEKFPNAWMNKETGEPDAVCCRIFPQLYGSGATCERSAACSECWKLPYFEEEKE